MISSLNESPLKKERDELSTQLLLETAQYPVPSIKDIRFFLNQFRKGDINDPKYRQGLADMHVNKISLYDDKMTILCNTQDGHFDVDIKEVSSLKRQLAEMRGVTLPGDQLRLVLLRRLKKRKPHLTMGLSLFGELTPILIQMSPF